MVIRYWGGSGKRAKNKDGMLFKNLENLYVNIKGKSPALFTGIDALYREAQKRGIKINRCQVKKFLEANHAYTQHKRVIRHFKRLPILAPGLHTHWQSDLADMQLLAKHNNGYSYILVCIDVLSRKLYSEPLRNKTAESMKDAFDAIFKRSNYIPWRVLTDQGKEFTSKSIVGYFHKLGIEQHSMVTSPHCHAPMAERAIRTIKERLYRYFTHQSTKCWIDVLQPLVEAINNSYCSSIKMKPVDVNFDNAIALKNMLKAQVREKFAKRRYNQQHFQIGDMVRIEKYKHAFEKGYAPNFTSEIFSVCKVRTTTRPITYRLVDTKGNVLEGWFYAQELSLIRIADSNSNNKNSK
ncbi:MAG TPA: transposase family protein, partial [Puia sp.]|nr:transposase family protein [Puia sp.]